MNEIHPLILIFASIFTSNILLMNFLGLCSFISISREPASAMGLGLAVTLVMTVTGVINWFVLHQLLIPFGLLFLRYIVFIVVIAATVQILEMVIDRYSPSLYMALGIFLPLITVNCAILGVALFVQIRDYSLIETAAFSFGSGVGWWLAIIALSAIQQKLIKSPIPSGLVGPGITLITIGIMAMAFSGFANMIPVQ